MRVELETAVITQDGIAVIAGLPDDDTRIKEDWVREEVTFPLLIRLGYSSTAGTNRIIRSRPLSHPFVMIGTTNKPVTLIPDYLLSVGWQICLGFGRKGAERNNSLGTSCRTSL